MTSSIQGSASTVGVAGFDAEKVQSLAGNEGPGGPGEPDRSSQTSSNQGLSLWALKSLKSILSQYGDLSSLTSDQQTDLISQLTQAGLLKNGSVLDLSA